ncbi:MAG TPA: very short patch repair endonuclease [Smithella sp.]|jgi:DNA mismatch endonuclease (patch repair protein)|nr:very short patch repair endonuclease [Smithella sp.]HOS14765.1 very short patch repair endonuclease [Smithella sp.]HPL48249.1 very short patch repair endonuclease [Smithella sp.]
MTDTFSPAERSRIMSRIRSRGNAATELRFVKILKQHKITGWRRHMALPGKPDFVFLAAKIAVFIDGDFWHGNPISFRLPKSNIAYWETKILGNKRRDRRINKILRTQGWRVVRFWQSSLSNESSVVKKLMRALEE